MISPVFEFFEVIAEELCSAPSRVITRNSLQANKDVSSLLDDLQQELKAATTDDAIAKAVDKLEMHFKLKTSPLPFAFDAATGRFEAKDNEFLEFVKEMSRIRSVGTKARSFECNVAQRLGKRATGSIHRVGHPRAKKKKKKQFNQHLRLLGFRNEVLLGREKDGGLDILWLLPIGGVPHQPFVSVQCKNGLFNLAEADKSTGAASRSLAQHGSLQEGVHVPCVLFNDYIHAEGLPRKPFNFVPLGLTDLASIDPPVTVNLV